MADRVVKVRLSAAVDEYRQGMLDAARATRAVGTEAEKLAQTRQALNTLGAAGLAMGAAIVAGIGVAVGKFAEFDQAMSYVAATGEDARDSIDSLREAALDAGARTVFSATEAANAIEELAKAGLSTRDVLAGGLNGALDLAAAGGLGVADAAGIAATTLQQFRLDGSAASHVADLLAAGAGKAMGDVSDLSQALAQGGLVANQFGLSVDETVGTLSAFASAGMLGSDAGTSFRTMLLRMANPTGEAAAKMQELGISAYDAQGNFIGMAGLAGQLEKSMKGLSQEQRNAALAIIFGQDAIRGANVLLAEGADGIQDWTDKVNDQGYAAETAATRLDNLIGDWEQFTGALDTAMISVGSAADGPLRGFVQMLTRAVDGFNDLPDWLKNIGLGVAAAAGGIGLVGGAALLAIPKIAELKVALDTLGMNSDLLMGKLSRLAKIGGGALIGFAAASAGLDLLTQAMQNLGDSAAVTDNKLASASSGAEVLNAALGKGFGSSQDIKIAEGAIANLGRMLDLSAKGAQATGKEITGVVSAGEAVLKLGGELGELASKDLGSAQRAFRMVAEEAGLTDEQMVALIDKMEPFKTALIEQATAAGESADSQTLLALALGDSSDGADSAEAALRALQGQSADTGEAVDDLADSIRGFGSAELDTRDAHRQLEQAFDDLTDSIAANGATLDVNEQAGRDNERALDDLASSTLEYAAALVSQTGDQQAASAAIADGRQRLIEMLAQFGITGAEAEGYADKLGLIPANIPTVVSLDASGATSKLSSLWNSLNNLVGKTWNIPVATTVVGQGTVLKDGFAAGGYVKDGVKAFAGGGFEPGIYAYAAGGIHKFAEEYDEAYISLDPARRSRSEAVWVKTGQELGMFGGQQTAPAGQASSPVVQRVAETINLVLDGRVLAAHEREYDRSVR